MDPLSLLFWFARAHENGIRRAFIEFIHACTDLAVLAKEAEDPYENIPSHILKEQLFWRTLTYRLMSLNTQGVHHEVLEAQYNLAEAYENGKEVPRSFLTAIYWYRKVAQQRYRAVVNKLQQYHKLEDVDIKELQSSGESYLPAL
ncbi:unnamed protein product, partial [Rotaria magnacalcarata]